MRIFIPKGLFVLQSRSSRNDGLPYPVPERVVAKVLVVACQVCGEFRILPGTPDSDGIARTQWTCPCCGTGQILQLPVSMDARGQDLGKILAGMAFCPSRTAAADEEDSGS